MRRSGGRAGWAVRWLMVCVLCCVTGASGLMPAAGAGATNAPKSSATGTPAHATGTPSFSAAGIDTAEPGSEGGGSSPFSGALVIAGSPEEGQQLANARRARLANPEAIVARERSRTAFEHLGATGAAKLAREAFPAVIDVPAGGPPPMRSGEKIVRYISDTAAQLSLPGGRHAVIESLGPIAARTSSGHFTPVNLALTDTGGSFTPVNSAAPVHIPKQLATGVAVPDAGVIVTPVNSSNTALGGARGAQDGAGVLYANTQTDTDTLVKPTTSGFEIDALLRSVDSPSTLYFRVGMPAGARLRRDRRSGIVRVVEGGKTLALVPTPTAQDSAGTAVPVLMGISGNLLVLDTARGSSDLQYPVEVDPQVWDEELTGVKKPTHWKFALGTGSTHFEASGWKGSSLYLESTGSYTSGETGWLSYQAEGEARIWDVSVTASGHNLGKIETFLQLTDGEKAPDTKLIAAAGGEFNASYTVCTDREETGCPLFGKESEAAPKNFVKFQEAATANGSGDNIATITKAQVKIFQEHLPTAGFNTTSKEIAGRHNVLYGNGEWLSKYNGAFEVSGSDPGVGVSSLNVSSGEAWSDDHNYFGEGLCEGVWCHSEAKEVILYPESKLLPDGEDKVLASARNTMNEQYGSGSYILKVDSTAPHGISLAGLPSNGQINEQAYKLKAEATDGSGGTPSSGIASIKLTVDGREVLGGASGSCQLGPCATTGEWTLRGERFGAGKHVLQVIATDNAGNKATSEEFGVTVRHAGGLQVGPGSVNPITGTVTFGANDVSIGGGIGMLGVSRSYDSRQLTQGESGPLGPQWQFSVAGSQEVQTEPTGSVTLIGANESRTTFESNGKGGFVSPPGDENLVLEAEKEGAKVTHYLLKNPVEGTTVKYTQLGSEGPWVVENSEGVLSKGNEGKQTFEWELLEGVTRPKREIESAPGGVNCSSSPETVRGCRTLKFAYATSTTATGEAPTEWKNYKGRLEKITFWAYEPVAKGMQSRVVAEYAYDKQGRLRAEWNPQLSPALKTTYGYDAESHVVAVNPPGQESALVHYGTTASDPGAGRLLSVTRLPAGTTTSVEEQDKRPAPGKETAPTLSSTSPVVGTTLEVSGNGTWSNSPLAYYYAWEECYTHESKETCAPIPGAANKSYTPQARDAGYTLKAQVTAVNADGATVASTAASSTIALTAPSWLRTFGEASLNHPAQDAVDAAGNVWVTNSYGNNVQKFSSTGTLLATYGSTGNEKGKVQFKQPDGIAINETTGNVYVASEINDRVLELNETGGFVAEFGSAGEGEGQLKSPSGVAIDPSGNVWVADNANNRIEKFSSAGAYIGAYGTKGSGEGQFSGPEGIAISGSNVYVSDLNNGRVEEFSLGGVYERQFGSKGSGSGQMLFPCEIGIDPNSGDVYVADSGNNRLDVFNSVGTYLTQFGIKGSEHGGELIEPEGVTFNSAGDAYVVDTVSSKIEEFEPKYSKNNPLPAPPAPGSSAVTTVDYNIPLEGAELQKLTKTEVETWGQKRDIPTEGAAVFPPDEPMGWPAKDYKRATVFYFDELGHDVNVANPSGGVSTSEYNETNEVIRSLSADNRATALKESTKTAKEEESERLDTKSHYNGETEAEKKQEETAENEGTGWKEPGTRLVETTGPEHQIRLAGSSTEKQARNHVRYSYDEGAPGGEMFGLPTKTIDSALYEGSDHEERTTISSYSGQEGLGWMLRKPTSVTTEPAGLHLTTTTVYDPATGKVLETRPPAGTSLSLPYLSKFTVAALEKASKPGLALDASGNLWVTGENKVEQYGPTGTKLLSVGKSGPGNGEYKEPRGIAIGAGKTVWVADSANNRVQQLNEKGEWQKTIGSVGEGAGLFKTPDAIAIGAGGAIWVTDSGNNRIEEFSPAGTFIEAIGFGVQNGESKEETCTSSCKAGLSGAGNGEFTNPVGVAVDALGNVWVVDTGNHRIEELGPDGSYVRQVGSAGAQGGQFESPSYITIDANGDLWVSDAHETTVDRVQEFSPTGAYLSSVGGHGSGNGQFGAPFGIAFDSKGNMWTADQSNNRLEQFTAPSGYVAKEYRKQVETAGEAALVEPTGVTVDSKGNTWVLSRAAKGEESKHEESLHVYSPAGRLIYNFAYPYAYFVHPASIAIDRNGHVWIASLHGVVEFYASYTRQVLEEVLEIPYALAPRSVTTDAEGNVWVLGATGGGVIEYNGEGTPIKTVTNAELKGAGGIAIDAKGNLLVADAEKNNVQEYTRAGVFVRKYGTEGSGNGQLKGPSALASTDAAGDVWVSDTGNDRLEEFNSKGEYVTQVGAKGKAAGQFETPGGIALGNEGEVWAADSTNNSLQKFGAAGTTRGAHDSETIYYTTAANATVPACGEHAEWAALPCQSKAAVQPGTTGLPNLPVVTDTYNIWDEPEKVEEKFEAIGTYPATTRTKKMKYDSAGRLETNEETSTIDTSLPAVTDKYSSETGAMIEQSTKVGETTKTIKSTYNTLGQITEYTDADANKSTYVYDIDGRVKEMKAGLEESAGKEAKQTYTYSPTSGELEELVDSDAKTFKAAYDVEGKMTSETYPNAMKAKYTFNATGETTGIEYEKTAHCAGTCPEVWFKETVAPSVHGEARARTSSLAKEEYTYDEVGRLTQANETLTGKGCKSRLYAYNEDSDRTSLISRESATETCATSGGTTESHSYDTADRLSDTGVSYDAFGNQTKVPAADAGGTEITATFYVDNQTRSQTQGTKTLTYFTDPDGRTREIVTKEGTESTAINHFSGPGEGISWVGEGAKWTRDIPGIDGTLTAIEKSGEETKPILQLHDLQGNVVATAELSETETKLRAGSYNPTEFGVPVNGTPPKYSWLGAFGQATELSSGASASGGSDYVSQLGAVLQTQPIVPPAFLPSPTGPYITAVSAEVIGQGTAYGAQAPAREAGRLKASGEQCLRSGACVEDPHEYHLDAGNELRALADELEEDADLVAKNAFVLELLPGSSGFAVGAVTATAVSIYMAWADTVAGGLRFLANLTERDTRRYLIETEYIKIKNLDNVIEADKTSFKIIYEVRDWYCKFEGIWGSSWSGPNAYKTYYNCGKAGIWGLPGMQF